MTRTVITAGGRYEIGMDYLLDDSLAEVWISYGVADRQEAPAGLADDDPGPIPPDDAETPDAADHARVTEGEV